MWAQDIILYGSDEPMEHTDDKYIKYLKKIDETDIGKTIRQVKWNIFNSYIGGSGPYKLLAVGVNVYKCGECTKRSHAFLVCSKCKKERYCSKECQKYDWEYHKEEECTNPTFIPEVEKNCWFVKCPDYDYFETRYISEYCQTGWAAIPMEEELLDIIIFRGDDPERIDYSQKLRPCIEFRTGKVAQFFRRFKIEGDEHLKIVKIEVKIFSDTIHTITENTRDWCYFVPTGIFDMHFDPTHHIYIESPRVQVYIEPVESTGVSEEADQLYDLDSMLLSVDFTDDTPTEHNRSFYKPYSKPLIFGSGIILQQKVWEEMIQSVVCDSFPKRKYKIFDSALLLHKNARDDMWGFMEESYNYDRNCDTCNKRRCRCDLSERRKQRCVVIINLTEHPELFEEYDIYHILDGLRRNRILLVMVETKPENYEKIPPKWKQKIYRMITLSDKHAPVDPKYKKSHIKNTYQCWDR